MVRVLRGAGRQGFLFARNGRTAVRCDPAARIGQPVNGPNVAQM